MSFINLIRKEARGKIWQWTLLSMIFWTGKNYDTLRHPNFSYIGQIYVSPQANQTSKHHLMGLLWNPVTYLLWSFPGKRRVIINLYHVFSFFSLSLYYQDILLSSGAFQFFTHSLNYLLRHLPIICSFLKTRHNCNLI